MAAAAADKSEVLTEVEAVQAVYGDDCRVLRPFPPHIDVHIRPRTADDSSQQFVEAVLGIRAGAQYPDEPPHMILVESKGLDEKRQEHLTAVLQNKAKELSSCLMLVALCEEAVDVLSNMNHPEGNCPLCLYPLFREDVGKLPFMKLMSCFHCFHSECILRWWKWLQQQTESNVNNHFERIRPLESQRGTCVIVSQHLGNCPVCRMVFHSKDIEHVLDLLEASTSEVSFEVADTQDGETEVIHYDVENTRRQKFEALLRLQQENSGLIEPKKDLVVSPGMFLPERITHPAVSSSENNVEHPEDVELKAISAGASNSASSKPTASVHKHSSMRRGRSHNPKKHLNSQSSRRQCNAQPTRKQWIKKENGMDD